MTWQGWIQIAFYLAVLTALVPLLGGYMARVSMGERVVLERVLGPVERVFYQCTKAIVRSKLWDPATQIDRRSLPSAGTILAEISGGKIGGPEHDRGQPERIQATLY